MARDEAPPFELGATWYGGGTIDTDNLGGVNLEGKEYVFEDPNGTGHPVRVRVVRNSGTINIKPKRLTTFASSYYGRRVAGHAAISAAYAFPVDPYLPAAGVPPNDLFYIIVSGPTLCKVTDSGEAIAVGDIMVALTASTSGTADSGRVTSALTLAADEAMNRVGRAMSAVTTGQTGADILVGVGW
jgi:hypothetical protein